MAAPRPLPGPKGIVPGEEAVHEGWLAQQKAAAKLSAAEVAAQADIQQRMAVIDAVMKEVRGEIEIVFGSSDSKPIGIGISYDKFLADGTTLVARGPVDTEHASEREYVLANRRITEIGREADALDGDGEDQGNKEQSQNPLDIYMDGLKIILAKLLRRVTTKQFGDYEVKVVATDTSNVDEVQRNHITVHDGLSTFIPPKASSKGKE